MKSLIRVLIGLCLAACVASARPELSPVSFVLGKQHFKSGDAIVIDQVLASSPQFEIGTKLVVRGHYRLASAAKAKIGLYLTHRAPAEADPSAQSQTSVVDEPSGTFELACNITYKGDAHVSFYPLTDGESIGGVYFSAPATDRPVATSSDGEGR